MATIEQERLTVPQAVASPPAEALIVEARQRQRRRRLRALAAIVATAAVAGVAYGVIRHGAGAGQTAAHAPLPVFSLDHALAQTPMLGIACPRQPNLTTCGRVGIAVWLTRPAASVSAQLGGRSIKLHAGGFGGRGPTYWEGYVKLSPTVLRLPAQWYGTRPVRFLRLELAITGKSAIAHGAVRLQLRPGWG